MPLTSEEVLQQLTDAIVEARKVIREAHEVHRSLRTAMKDQRDTVTNAIVKEVTEQLGEFEEGVKEDMHTRLGAVIDGIAADWRDQLGLRPAARS